MHPVYPCFFAHKPAKALAATSVVVAILGLVIGGAKSNGVERAFVDGTRDGEPYRVVLAKDFFGTPSNHWVVTAYTKPQKMPGEPEAGL